MYISAEMSREYYEFLWTEIRSRLEACEIYAAWVDVDKKREVLALLGVREICVYDFDGADTLKPIGECSDFEIDRAASQALFAMRDYIKKFPSWEEEQKAREIKDRQLEFDFTGSIRVGGPDHLPNNVSRADIYKEHCKQK